MQLMKHLLILASMLVFTSAHAVDATEQLSEPQLQELDVIDWELAFKRMDRLSPMGYHPFLMPLLMDNRDFIELDKDQLAVFKRWRDKNRVPLLHMMNRIVTERNNFHRLSLNPLTREEVLKSKQEEIFKLQQKVLQIQLSCRRDILDTLSQEQWENFNFVLNEYGYETDLVSRKSQTLIVE